jgi:hypothetical protein
LNQSGCAARFARLYSASRGQIGQSAGGMAPGHEVTRRRGDREMAPQGFAAAAPGERAVLSAVV